MNIYDISRKAGVSIATVSRVLNHSPHVSQETKKRVMDVINSNGYVPNAFARGLGLNTMKTIGLLCPDASDGYLSAALAYLESGFRAAGYDCLLFCTGNDLEARNTGIMELINRHVDGLLLMGSSFVEEKAQDNDTIIRAAESLPVVLLNGDLEGKGLYSICCDDAEGIRQGIRLLTSHGKKDILFLNHSRNDSARRKLTGYVDGLAECGIAFRPELVRYIARERQNIKDVKEDLLALSRDGLRFDAIICSDDLLALAGLKYAYASGINVPDQLEIIGYDNTTYAVCTQPELTSVDSRLASMCAACVETMMQVLSGSEAHARATYCPGLVLRETTRA